MLKRLAGIVIAGLLLVLVLSSLIRSCSNNLSTSLSEYQTAMEGYVGKRVVIHNDTVTVINWTWDDRLVVHDGTRVYEVSRVLIDSGLVH